MKRLILTTLFLSVLSPLTYAAVIMRGDAIKVDFGDAGDGDGGSLTDWNQMAANGTLGAGTVIRHGDGAVVDDVTVTLAGRNGDNNDPAGSGWGGIGSDPYFIAAADDILFSSDSSPLTVTFGGLDKEVNYTVRVYSLLTGEGFTAPINVTAGIIGHNGLNRNALHATVPLSEDLIFEGVGANPSGQVVVSVSSAQPFSIQAITLEAATFRAIPEPSTVSLLAMGAGLVLYRRKRTPAAGR